MKAPLRRIILWWNTRVELDRTIIYDLMEYHGLSYDETVSMMKLGKKLNRDLWNILEPTTLSDEVAFYQRTPYIVFDNAYWHAEKHQRLLRKEILSSVKGRVLDYGGGVGDLSAEIANHGFDVTYADIEGNTMKFAKYLFNKRGVNIKTFDMSDNNLEKLGFYDTIISLDVIEHTPNPEYTLRSLIEHLNENGRLIVTNLYPNKTKEYPMHREFDFDAEVLLKSYGLNKNKDKEWLWIQVQPAT